MSDSLSFPALGITDTTEVLQGKFSHSMADETPLPLSPNRPISTDKMRTNAEKLKDSACSALKKIGSAAAWVATGGAKVLAGLVGGALFIGAGITCFLLSKVVVGTVSFVGAVVGGILGALNPWGKAESGAKIGGVAFAATALFAVTIPTKISLLLGAAGSGLLGFALKDKDESCMKAGKEIFETFKKTEFNFTKLLIEMGINIEENREGITQISYQDKINFGPSGLEQNEESTDNTTDTSETMQTNNSELGSTSEDGNQTKPQAPTENGTS